MGTTPIFGWRYPASTDDVRPYEDIQFLASDAEATVASRGIVGWGNRTTTAAGTTTEVGILRIDSIPIVSGLGYHIWTSSMSLYSNVSNDVVAARIRASTSGNATTSSTQVGLDLPAAISSLETSHPSGYTGQWFYKASTTGNLSVLLSVARFFGTGTAQILSGVDLVVECIGIAPADTGVDI